MKLNLKSNRNVTISRGRLVFFLITSAAISAALTVFVVHAVRSGYQKNHPPFLGGWYMNTVDDSSDGTEPFCLNFSGSTVVVQDSAGDSVTCKYDYSIKDRTITVKDYRGKNLLIRYSTQPFMHIWTDSDGIEWDAKYSYAG